MKKTKKEENKETQKGWFRTEVDFENSFKWWFALQWQNHYIHLFLAFLTMFVLQLVNFETVWGLILESYAENIGIGLFVTPFLFLPLAGASIIAYKGFWQYFNDLKNGTSR
jgi:hypothetical protein